MRTALSSTLSQIKDLSPTLFKKADLKYFFEKESEALDDEELTALYDDLYAFNAYMGRTEGYPSLERVPFWEYSLCLEWAESHIMFGRSFELTLKNAARFLGNLRKYYEYLAASGRMKDLAELDKAQKTICGGKRLKLVRDIPYLGTETYTEIYAAGKSLRFDMADYWILILHATFFDGNWTKVLEAAFGVSTDRVRKIKDLRERMATGGYAGLKDIMYADVTEAEAGRAMAWFFAKES